MNRLLRVSGAFLIVLGALAAVCGWLISGVPRDPVNWMFCAIAHCVVAFLLAAGLLLWREAR